LRGRRYFRSGHAHTTKPCDSKLTRGAHEGWWTPRNRKYFRRQGWSPCLVTPQRKKEPLFELEIRDQAQARPSCGAHSPDRALLPADTKDTGDRAARQRAVVPQGESICRKRTRYRLAGSEGLPQFPGQYASSTVCFLRERPKRALFGRAAGPVHRDGGANDSFKGCRGADEGRRSTGVLRGRAPGVYRTPSQTRSSHQTRATEIEEGRAVSLFSRGNKQRRRLALAWVGGFVLLSLLVRMIRPSAHPASSWPRGLQRCTRREGWFV